MPLVGIEPRSSQDLVLYWLCQPGMCLVEDFWIELCLLYHFTFWTLIISRINRPWLYKGLKDSGWQPRVDLAQSIEHWHGDHSPLGSNFLLFFCSFPRKPLFSMLPTLYNLEKSRMFHAQVQFHSWKNQLNATGLPCWIAFVGFVNQNLRKADLQAFFSSMKCVIWKCV